MAFISNSTMRNDSIEKVRGLDYFWLAILKDGKRIPQFNKDGSENLAKLVFDEEKKGNLKEVYWIPFRIGKPYGIQLKEGQKLILLRRGYVNNKGERKIVYMLGYEKGEIMFISPSGKTYISNDFNYDFMED